MRPTMSDAFYGDTLFDNREVMERQGYGLLSRRAIVNGTDKGPDGHDFARIYEGFFRFRRQAVERVLEVGVARGASMRMWRDYFPSATIVGIDKDPQAEPKDVGLVPYEFHVADQRDREALRAIVAGRTFDVIVDDGGHHMDEQLVTLATLFPALALNGLYLLEDVHTSYLAEFGAPAGTRTVNVLHDLAFGRRFTCEHLTAFEIERLLALVGNVWLFHGREVVSLTAVLQRR